MRDTITIGSSLTDDASAVVCNSDTFACLQTLPSNFFRLIISSPPYNIGKTYEKQTNLEDYLQWQERIIAELCRTLCDNGSIVWQIGNYVEKGEVFPLDIYFYPVFKKMGLRLRNRIIWHFEHGLHASKRFSGRYETALWFTKSDDYVFNLDSVRVPSKYPGKLHYKGKKIGQPSGNPLGKNPSDYWTLLCSEWESGRIDIPNVKSNHPEKTIHPCQFPIELIERFVLALTNPNDWVLDPFGGVGSTVIAAIKHLRKGMMIDKEVEYITIAKQRISDFENGTLKIRPLGKPIHMPSGREKVAQIPLSWTKDQR
jgi:DNA modification methylase